MMSDKIIFTPDQVDALQEVVNLGMGQAGAALSEILEGFVKLQVPDIQFVTTKDLPQILNGCTEKHHVLTIARQSFVNHLNGEIIFIYGQTTYDLLGEMMGFENEDLKHAAKKSELLLEISNSLASACLSGLSSELAMEIDLVPPVLVCLEKKVEKPHQLLFHDDQFPLQHTLLIRIDFTMGDLEFSCEILIFISQDSLNRLGNSLNALLDA